MLLSQQENITVTEKIIITPDVFGIMVSNDVLEKTEPI